MAQQWKRDENEQPFSLVPLRDGAAAAPAKAPESPPPARLKPVRPVRKPERESSRPNVGSQSKTPPSGGPQSSQPVVSRQPSVDSQRAKMPEVKGDTRLPHRYTDHLCKTLKPDEQAVFVQLYRLSWGWNKPTCFISNPRLSERSNVPLSSMKRAVAGLVAKGMIEKTGQANGYGKEQGVEYRVLNLDWQPNVSSQPNVGTNKEKLYKEKLKADFTSCPDCKGTGFYYPDGVDKGVAKCRHLPLKHQQS